MKVTLEFHDSRKERPEKSGEYVVMNRSNYLPSIICVPYSKQHDLFNAYDGDYAGGADHGVEFDFWACIPDECREDHHV